MPAFMSATHNCSKAFSSVSGVSPSSKTSIFQFQFNLNRGPALAQSCGFRFRCSSFIYNFILTFSLTLGLIPSNSPFSILHNTCSVQSPPIPKLREFRGAK